MPSAALFLFGALVLSGPLAGSSEAREKPPPPELSIAAPTEPVLAVTQEEDGTTTAEAVVFVSSAGAEATGVQFSLFADDGGPIQTSSAQVIASEDSDNDFGATIGTGSLVPLRLTFALSESQVPQEAVLVLTAARKLGAQPAVSELTVERTIQQDLFWIPVRWGLFGAVGILVLVFLGILIRKDEKFPAPNSPVHTDAAWSFSDSWATNITVIGALLTTILGATDILNEILPGVSLTRFSALSLVFGVIATGAPLVYILFGHREEVDQSGTKTEVTRGTAGGLIAAAALTSVAVVGQLRTIGLLVQIATSDSTVKATLLGLLIAAGVAIGLYAVRSLLWLIRAKESVPAGARLGTAPAGPSARASGTI